jgi:cytochrome c oxidase cbb3-type subunit 3
MPATARCLAFCAWLLCGAVIADDFSASHHEAGRTIYNFRCYYCHGYSGNARTLAATYLQPPPADFTRERNPPLSTSEVIAVLEAGRPGTAMKSFASVLNSGEIRLVADFVVSEFARMKAVNTRYHTQENGWGDHERYRIAFPFATGEIPLSRSWESLSPEQVRGKRLYLSTCVSCHDRGAKDDDAMIWDARPLSYPRNNYVPGGGVDAMAGASTYALHDVPKRLRRLTSREKQGEQLYLANCAFCHAADGSGKNWIGSFLEPHPRNLSDPVAMQGMTEERLATVIRNGLPGTSMPAWKNVLNSRQIEAIIAYVQRAFYPPLVRRK